ncbi:hypothetical protein [Halostreptopolyspora alba]|uniref:hypothetical protein n=1 Tax=Halostreptopolyspora alba TaxID=2487137 RepID=UPI0011CE4C4D
MAHSAPDPTHPGARTDPGLSARFAALLVAFLLVAGLLSAVVWYYGGFASARDTEPKEPGTAVRNDLFTVTPTEAAVRTGDTESGGSRVVVHAKLTSHETEAEHARTFTNELMEAHLLPAGAEGESGIMEQVRDPGTAPISWVQPGLTETVLLVWDLPEGVSPEEVERVRLRVLDAKEGAGFVDESERWWNLNGKSVGAVDLPVEGE